MPLPSRDNPPGSNSSAESDFVILPRPSLGNGNNGGPGSQQHSDNQQQLRSQFSSPASPTNGGTNCVTIMQYEQLVNTARAMKEENQMLKGQLTDMTKTIESRIEDFTKGKNNCKLAKEKFKELRQSAQEEVTRLRNHIVKLETELKEHKSGKTKEGQADAETKIKALEEKVEQLEQELRSSQEEVVVSIASDNSKASDTKDQPSIVTQLNNDIEDIQATRLDFKTKKADLEQALQKSAADLKHFKQRLEQLQLEKQDLLSLNNELQTMVSIYSRSGKRLQAKPSMRDAGVDQTMEEVESEFTFERPGESFPGAGEQEAAQTARSKGSSPGYVTSPTTVVQKTNIALQDVLLQLQAEREKVTSLMEDLKKEREDRNKIETTLMEQLNACSGEHHTAVENLNHKHQEQVSELSRKLDELAIANQEPHYSLELKHQVRSLVCELQERESVLQQTEATATDLCAQNEALKAKIALYHDELEEVRKQDTHMIESLRQELMRQQTTVQLEKQKGLIERIDYEKLKTDHDKLNAEYADLTRRFTDIQTTRRKTASTAAFNELQEERDNYLAQLMSAEEAIGARNSQLENVRRELDKVRREFGEAKIQLDTIPVLEAQAEIYKNDFDAERAAREKSHTDMELLMVDMERLREDNQRMQEELATHTKVQLQQMQNRHSTGSSSGGFYNTLVRPFVGPRIGGRRSASESLPETDSDFVGLDVSQVGDRVFDEAGTGVDHRMPASNHPPSSSAIIRCPKCQDEFPDIDTLQIHMLDCIN
ncbi:optineurin-like [Asterias amurensis]|uniref:optineurin-like n=1 Tax=Asterias amurensis TaxID=7602 RepID=UPI003AB7C950